MKVVKPETIIKGRMQAALQKVLVEQKRALGNEEYLDERPSQGYRVLLSGPNRFFFGQARYEGVEGTWLCNLNREATKVAGMPLKKDENVPAFGIEQCESVGSRSDEELTALLASGKKELVFQTGSHWTITIRRAANVNVQYQITWRDRNEEPHLLSFYTGLDAFEQIRCQEALVLTNFRIAEKYDYK